MQVSSGITNRLTKQQIWHFLTKKSIRKGYALGMKSKKKFSPIPMKCCVMGFFDTRNLKNSSVVWKKIFFERKSQENYWKWNFLENYGSKSKTNIFFGFYKTKYMILHHFLHTFTVKQNFQCYGLKTKLFLTCAHLKLYISESMEDIVFCFTSFDRGMIYLNYSGM